MKQLMLIFALIPIAGAADAAAPIEGKWKNPKGSVIINVAACGAATYCGRVAWATAKAKADARQGGTANLVGTSLLTGLRATGQGNYRGRVLLPKRDIHATAYVRAAGPNAIDVKGCAVAGILCKEQRWTRVN